MTWRARVEFICVVVVLMAVVLGIASFATTHAGSTTFGRPLGEDFAQFYDAGAVLNQGHPQLLYDHPTEDRAYHKLFPRLGPGESLPYLYPPLVAEAFRPVAELSYPWALAIWLILALLLYGIGFKLLWSIIGSGTDRVVLLLGLAFEPLLFESVLGGQLSAIAFAAFAGFLYLDRHDRNVAAGAVLGLCLYKPTLLLFVVPLLVLIRKWRAIAGVLGATIVLVGLSLATAGSKANRAFVRALTDQLRSANGAGSNGVRRWKFVDLNDFLHLIFGNSTAITAVVALAMIAALIVLYLAKPPSGEGVELWWAAVLTATVSVNVYVGAYDSVLLVLAGALMFVALRQRPDSARLLPRFQVLVAVILGLAWVTQPLARSTGVQLMTIALLAALAFQIKVVRNRPAAGPGSEAPTPSAKSSVPPATRP